MRLTLVAALVLFGLSTSAFGQPGSYFATVIDTGTKLRAGAGTAYPDTATLQQGDRLLVDHEESNGWLAVQDAPGKLYSLSWVPFQYVNFDTTKTLPQNVTVEDDTTLAAGQLGIAQPLTYVRPTKVPAGTILTVIGAKVKYEGKSWYPVVPPSGDFRYIAKQSVRADSAANTSFTIRESSSTQLPGNLPPAAIPPAGSNIPPQSITKASVIVGPPVIPTAGGQSDNPATSATSPSPAKPIVQNPLWAQAEAAEQAGRLDDAEKLYFQLARLMNEPGGDHDIANMCYTRIHSLREKKRAGSSGSTSTAPRATLGTSAQTGNASLTSAGSPGVTSSGAITRPGYAASGKLSRSALDIDGRKTYALEGTPGVPVAYVVAGQGVDLERYINKRVDVYGSSTTRRDLSKPLIVASSAETTPQ
jgi:hypothetical protein